MIYSTLVVKTVVVDPELEDTLVEETGVMDIPELVGARTMVGGGVGAPENPGSGRGVAYIVPSGPSINKAESSTFPSSSASSGLSEMEENRVHWPVEASFGPLKVTAIQAPGCWALRL